MWTGLSPSEARSLLVQKDKAKKDKRMSISEAVSTLVKDGYNLGIGGFVNSRQPVATVHEIIRQGKKDLLLSFHSAGLAVEYLAGAMALDQQQFSIKHLEFAYWGIELFGISSMLRFLSENGLVELEDWSNFNMSVRFKAAAMGLPFLPCRSPLGSDVLKANRSKIIDCPFSGESIALLPACHPHVALIHVQEADIYGNCRIEGPLFTCPEIALAAAHTLVTCERIIPHEEMVQEPSRINIPFFAVDAVVEIPFGAYPGNCHSRYYFDESHINEFRCATEAFRKGERSPLERYYEQYIYGVTDTDGMLEQIPYRQLKHIQQIELREAVLMQESSNDKQGDGKNAH